MGSPLWWHHLAVERSSRWCGERPSTVARGYRGRDSRWGSSSPQAGDTEGEEHSRRSCGAATVDDPQTHKDPDSSRERSTGSGCVHLKSNTQFAPPLHPFGRPWCGARGLSEGTETAPGGAPAGGGWSILAEKGEPRGRFCQRCFWERPVADSGLSGQGATGDGPGPAAVQGDSGGVFVWSSPRPGGDRGRDSPRRSVPAAPCARSCRCAIVAQRPVTPAASNMQAIRNRTIGWSDDGRSALICR